MDSTSRALVEFFHINNNSVSPQVVWDTMKAFLRGVLLKVIGVYKKTSWERESLLAAEAQQKEVQYTQSPTTSNCRVWKDAQLLYNQTSMNKAARSGFLSRCRSFEIR